MLDLILTGGLLIDPESMKVERASLGILGGKIVGRYPCGGEPEAKQRLDAGGLAVAPGFIDIHAHLDGHRECGHRALRQGITTSFGGNCGLSPDDMEAFFREQASGYCVNQGEFVGHSFTLRKKTNLSDTMRAASQDQIRRMEDLARKDMDAGAWGVSFGLDYCPRCSFDEVLALGKLTAQYGGICPIHTRLFTMYDMYSIIEATRLALECGVQVQVSHLVYQYPMNDLLDDAFEVMDLARAQGANLACDSGMYTDFAAPLGSATFDPEVIDLCDWSFERMLVSTGKYKGQWLTETLYRKLRREAPETEIVCFSGDEEAVQYAYERDYVMMCTDAGNYLRGQGHPQAAASYPRFFRIMVRETGRMSWPEAVRRCTLLPAETLGLTNKGRLSEGSDADLVVFDLEKFTDRADFAGIGIPDAPPEGLKWVFIGGKMAVEGTKIVNDGLGKIILHQ